MIERDKNNQDLKVTSPHIFLSDIREIVQRQQSAGQLLRQKKFRGAANMNDLAKQLTEKLHREYPNLNEEIDSTTDLLLGCFWTYPGEEVTTSRAKMFLVRSEKVLDFLKINDFDWTLDEMETMKHHMEFGFSLLIEDADRNDIGDIGKELDEFHRRKGRLLEEVFNPKLG